MRNRLTTAVVLLVSLLNLFAPAASVYATDVTVSENCTVKVTFKATVPASIQQGSSFTITNISVQPGSSYGFNVTSSVFDMTATNTSSSTYSQNFTTTNPSPTTGHNTYVGIYPNWSLNATGPVGGSIAIQLKRTVTVVQGYGTVTCNFSKILATIPITAPPAPSPSPSPSPSHIPTPSPSGGTIKKSSSSPSPSASASTTPTPSASASTTPTPSPSTAPDKSDSDDTSPSVVPLNIQVKDPGGKPVKGALVTVDGSQKSTTDGSGKVTFSNVLTGRHAILVSYKGQNISRNIQLTTADVGSFIPINLPAASSPFNPAVLAGIAIAVIALGAPAALFIVRRMRQTGGDAATQDITLSTIMDGSAVPTPAAATLTQAPAIQVFEPQAASVAPAPWEPAPVAAAVEQSVPSAQPAPEPQPATVPTVPATEAAQPQAVPEQPSTPAAVEPQPAVQPVTTAQVQAAPQTPAPEPQQTAAAPTPAPVQVQQTPAPAVPQTPQPTQPQVPQTPAPEPPHHAVHFEPGPTTAT